MCAKGKPLGSAQGTLPVVRTFVKQSDWSGGWKLTRCIKSENRYLVPSKYQIPDIIPGPVFGGRSVIDGLTPEVIVVDRLYEFDRKMFGIEEMPPEQIRDHAHSVARQIAETL